jgi:hypothetical protein
MVATACLGGGSVKGPNLKCCFCYGAWNSMDRWFQTACSCIKPCDEPRCKARAFQR